jgi:steroid 5-alpha reductase family enzyme
MSGFELVILGWLAVAGLMALLWLVQLRTGDAGIVDVAWAAGVGLLSAGFAALSPGQASRQWMVLAVVLVWAVRLAGYVLVRVLTQPEDGRYTTLKQQWGPAAAWKMFRFYQLQAVGVVLFALPILIALRNPQPLNLLDWIGLAVGILSITGESIADWQLSRFRSRPENRGQVCERGLWRYSRHPNYFFEWLHWWAYVCFALSNWPWGAVTLLGPLTMWYLITRVTGIPPTEAQSLKSRGEAYRRYQQTTSPFFPWFRRSNSKTIG